MVVVVVGAALPVEEIEELVGADGGVGGGGHCAVGADGGEQRQVGGEAGGAAGGGVGAVGVAPEARAAAVVRGRRRSARMGGELEGGRPGRRV